MNKTKKLNYQNAEEIWIAYIWKLVHTGMPDESCDLAKERVVAEVLLIFKRTIKEKKLRAIHGDASIKTFLARVASRRCSRYYRKYDPETDMERTPGKIGSQRSIAKRRRERWYMDKEDILEAFKTFKIDFQKDVKHKEVFLLYMEGKKLPEIAKTTGLTPKQIKNKHEYTIRKLAKNPKALLALKNYAENPRQFQGNFSMWELMMEGSQSLAGEIDRANKKLPDNINDDTMRHQSSMDKQMR